MLNDPYRVRVVGLPLPLLRLWEGRTGPTLRAVADASFPDLPNALDHARPLARIGYGLEITCPDGLVWDHRRVIGELNSPARTAEAVAG
jgi:hypothetical protein